MEPSKEGLVLAWSGASERDRIALYRRYPKWRETFMGLPGDKLFLLQQLNISEWPNLGVFESDTQRFGAAKIIVKALAALPRQEAMSTLNRIQQPHIRRAIMQRLKPESRKKVEKSLSNLENIRQPEKESLAALPTKLVTEIARSVQGLWDFALTSRGTFRISADVWMQQVKNGEKNGDVLNIYTALRCMSHLGDTGELAGRFCEYIQAQAIKDISNHKISDAGWKLALVKELPPSVGVPDNCFVDVTTAIRVHAIRAIESFDVPKATSLLQLMEQVPPNTGNFDGYLSDTFAAIRAQAIRKIEASSGYGAILVLGLTKMLSPGNGVSAEGFLDVATAIRDQIIRNIRALDTQLFIAEEMLEVLEHLPSVTMIPRGFFNDVVTAVRARVLHIMGDQWTSQADERSSHFEKRSSSAGPVLALIKQLPSDTIIPENYFFEVVTAVQVHAVRFLEESAPRKAATMLQLLEQLPSNTAITGICFFNVVTAIRDCAVRSVGDSHVSDARKTLRLIAKLPPNTSIPDDYFFELVTAVRSRAIQAIEGHETREAISILELISLLPLNTNIPNNFFLDAVTHSTASVIRQPVYKTTVPDADSSE